MGKPWFKLWREAWTDRAILDLSAHDRWLWLTCLKLADEGDVEGEVQLPDWTIEAAANLRPERATDRVHGISALVKAGLVKRTKVGIVIPRYERYQTDPGWGGKRSGAGRPRLESKTHSRRNQVEKEKLEVRTKRSQKGETGQELEIASGSPTSQGPTLANGKPREIPECPTRRDIAESVWSLYHPNGEKPRHDRQLFAFWKAKDSDARRMKARETMEAGARA